MSSPYLHQRPPSLKVGDIGMGPVFPAPQVRDITVVKEPTDALCC